ncbi:hypothetical protein [Deinococcus sp. NW-56]|uniref:hypothetical protein n=1 Tax=Deinococcus sp. NW-56 TaxID=2080419 RepID=UPI000CF48E04|nr:hypothetical protein [Deinococcus sp. NW-56]
MTDLLIGLGLIGVPAALTLGFWKLRPGLERGSGRVDPLTGALFFGAVERGAEGLKLEEGAAQARRGRES